MKPSQRSVPTPGAVSGDRSLRRTMLYAFEPLPLNPITSRQRAHPRSRRDVHSSLSNADDDQ